MSRNQDRSPDYTALGLAAAAGAIGALATQAAFNYFFSGEGESSSYSRHRRRGSLIPNDELSKRSIRAVCFDMDGTLINTQRIWYMLIVDAMSHFKSGSPEDLHYDHYLQHHFGQSMQANRDCWFPAISVDELNQYCCDNFHKYLSLLEIIDGAPESLIFANQVTNDKTYIITNCPRPITLLILQSEKGQSIAKPLTGPDGKLRVICAGDIGTDGNPLISKPSISMPSEVSKLLSCSTHEMILLGDSVFDIETIHAAGGIGVLLCHDSNNLQQDETLKNPFLKIQTLGEFYQIQQLFNFPAISGL